MLAVPDLRSMYMRRLRSIMDEYTNGKLAGVRQATPLTPSPPPNPVSSSCAVALTQLCSLPLPSTGYQQCYTVCYCRHS